MPGSGVLDSLQFTPKETTEFLTLGQVVDTNDPKQMGRVRVRCGAYNDKLERAIKDLPWALPISPLAGVVTQGTRGTEQEGIDGPVAYGMWNVPTVGAFVLVGCIDGDTSKRFYLGCIHPQHVTTTTPHGRFIWGEETKDGEKPGGPMSTTEMPIEPLYSSITDQFTKPTDADADSRRAGGTPSDSRKENAEYMSRGADMQHTAMDETQIQDPHNNPGSAVADHTQGGTIEVSMPDGSTRKIRSPGYSVSQVDPTAVKGPKTAGVNYDSHLYSWTTPGFHAFSMDDRYDNCRIRLRTTSGHQIIMDDTNERIYVSAAGGKTYIEIDKVGNIDIFADKNISTHARGDINFYSDKTIRMQAKEGIHFRTDDEIRMHSEKDFHIRTEQNLRSFSGQETRIEATTKFHTVVHGIMYIKTAGSINIKSGDKLNIDTTSDIYAKVGARLNIDTTLDINIKTSMAMKLDSNDKMSLVSGTRIAGDAPDIHWNSGYAVAASPSGNTEDAAEAHEKSAYWTSRVPEHEPWARVSMKKNVPNEGADNDGLQNGQSPTTGDPADLPDMMLPYDNTHTAEYEYTNAMVGKGSAERGDIYTRNEWWRR